MNGSYFGRREAIVILGAICSLLVIAPSATKVQMDWLTFIAKLIEFGAWPVVAGAIFWHLRKSVVDVLSRINKAKFKDLELEFKEALLDAKEAVAEEKLSRTITAKAGEDKITGHAPTISVRPAAELALRDRLIKLADAAPRAAVLEAWLEVEHAAQRLIIAKGISNRPLRTVGPQVLFGYLEKVQAVSPEQAVVFEKLRKLRNRVVHYAAVSIPVDAVIEYVDLALELSEQFNTAAGVLPDGAQ